MKMIFKNISLVVLSLVASKFTAVFFGSVYNYFSPQYDDSWFSLTQQELVYLVGLPFAHVFFTILLVKIFGEGNKKKWIGWLLLPAALFFAVGDLKHIYLPILLGVVAWLLAKVVQVILVKIKLR